MSTDTRDVRISKALSKLLRHSAIKEKIQIDKEGWVNTDHVISHPRLKSLGVTCEDLDRVVKNCNKQRFKIENDKIRANQGHLISEVLTTSLSKLTFEAIPCTIYHGTYLNKLPAIYASGGLSRMKRNQIHFTLPSLPQILGVRNNVTALIYINVQKCLNSGLEFYLSDNGVILSPGNQNGYISIDLFEKITDRAGNRIDTDGFPIPVNGVNLQVKMLEEEEE